MDCVNHPGVSATAYCQNCGKAMCAACVRQGPGGQIMCEPCWTAWQGAQAPFVPAPPPGVPNPVLAGILGIIPGVGAMYNGQFVKGFIHVIVFAILVSISGHHGIFGLFIAAWVVYQVFDAYHTAKSRRDGEPVPDPLGLNELAGWFQTAAQAEYRRAHGIPPAHGMPPVQQATGTAGPQGAAGSGTAAGSTTNVPPYQQQPPYQGATPYQGAQYSNPYQSGYQPPPFTGVPPVAGFTPPAAGFTSGYSPGYGPGAPPVPPVPPVPPMHWRRREPIAAIILIGLGVLFLLGQFDWFTGRVFEYTWPLLLIALGVWLVMRRMQDTPPAGGMPPVPQAPINAAQAQTEHEDDRNGQGGSL